MQPARWCRRCARQVRWAAFPSKGWTTAHETACVFHALHGGGGDDNELTVPVELPRSCCPLRLLPEFDPPHAEVAYREFVKEGFSWTVIVGASAWLAVMMFYSLMNFFVAPNVNLFPELGDPFERPIVFGIEVLLILMLMLTIVTVVSRHWMSADTYFRLLVVVSVAVSFSRAARLFYFHEITTFFRNWGTYSITSKVSAVFFSGTPLRPSIVFLTMDTAMFMGVVLLRNPPFLGNLLLFNVVFLLVIILLAGMVEIQRRREFTFRCEIAARKHTMQEVTDVYAFLAESTSDVIAVHDAARPAHPDAPLHSLRQGGVEGALPPSLSAVRPRFRYVSPACARNLGWLPSELLGVDPFVLIHPSDRSRAARLFNASPFPDEEEEAHARHVFGMRGGEGNSVATTLYSDRASEDRRALDSERTWNDEEGDAPQDRGFSAPPLVGGLVADSSAVSAGALGRAEVGSEPFERSKDFGAVVPGEGTVASPDGGGGGFGGGGGGGDSGAARPAVAFSTPEPTPPASGTSRSSGSSPHASSGSLGRLGSIAHPGVGARLGSPASSSPISTAAKASTAAEIAPFAVRPLLSSLGTVRAEHRSTQRAAVVGLVFRLNRLRNLGLSAAAADAEIVVPEDLGVNPGSRYTVSSLAALGLSPAPAPPLLEAGGQVHPASGSMQSASASVHVGSARAGVRSAAQPISAMDTVTPLDPAGSVEPVDPPPRSLPASAARIRVEPRASPETTWTNWDADAHADLRRARNELQRFLYESAGAWSRAGYDASGGPDHVAADEGAILSPHEVPFSPRPEYAGAAALRSPVGMRTTAGVDVEMGPVGSRTLDGTPSFPTTLPSPASRWGAVSRTLATLPSVPPLVSTLGTEGGSLFRRVAPSTVRSSSAVRLPPLDSARHHALRRYPLPSAKGGTSAGAGGGSGGGNREAPKLDGLEEAGDANGVRRPAEVVPPASVAVLERVLSGSTLNPLSRSSLPSARGAGGQSARGAGAAVFDAVDEEEGRGGAATAPLTPTFTSMAETRGLLHESMGEFADGALAGQDSAVDLRFWCRDGRYRWMEVTGNPTALGLVCVYRRMRSHQARLAGMVTGESEVTDLSVGSALGDKEE